MAGEPGVLSSRPERDANSDAALLSAIAGGDARALASLYDRYAVLAFSIASAILRDHALAEDVVHDVFLQIWRRAGTFDARRGAARSWVAQMVRNRSVDILRSRRRMTDIQIEELGALLEDPREDPADQAAERWLRARVEEALKTLTPAHRQVLALSYLRGLTHTEIAERLKMPLGSVKSRIRQAVTALRRTLGEGGTP